MDDKLHQLRIEAGIKNGLGDVRQGHFVPFTAAFARELKLKFRSETRSRLR